LEEIEELKAEVEKLKAELLDINAKHHRDTQKTCLKAKFDTWREEQVKHNSDSSLEEEAQWLVYEAVNIQDAIEVFNELYDDGIGDDYTWRLECDHERNWEINQLYMDDEGEYTLTEEEWKRNNTSQTNPLEIYMSDKARGLEHSTGTPKKKRIIVKWFENGVVVEKLLMRERSYHHSHKKECGKYAPAPRGGVKPTENGWMTCDPTGNMMFIENGEFVNGHYLADFTE
jgi:hypothetical protein